jgi:hypothetical protein
MSFFVTNHDGTGEVIVLNQTLTGPAPATWKSAALRCMTCGADKNKPCELASGF